MTTQICLAAEKFAPNSDGTLIPFLRVLKLAGNYVREEILSAFIRLVCHTPELQAYTVQKLFSALHQDFSQESLTLGAVWVIGEFGDVLVQGGNFEDEELVREVQAKDVVTCFLRCSKALMSTVTFVNSCSPHSPSCTLAFRIATEQARIEQIIGSFVSSVEVEIQQRSVEFATLLKRSDIREGVLESMPPPEIKQTVLGTVSEAKRLDQHELTRTHCWILMGDEMPVSSSSGASAGTGGSTQQSTHDLLADIFGGSDMGGASATPAAGAPTQAAQKPKSSVNDILGLFGDSGSTPAPAAAPLLRTGSFVLRRT